MVLGAAAAGLAAANAPVSFAFAAAAAAIKPVGAAAGLAAGLLVGAASSTPLGAAAALHIIAAIVGAVKPLRLRQPIFASVPAFAAAQGAFAANQAVCWPLFAGFAAAAAAGCITVVLGLVYWLNIIFTFRFNANFLLRYCSGPKLPF